MGKMEETNKETISNEEGNKTQIKKHRRKQRNDAR
jgi:hypothetical protein